jgi:flagellar protein FlaH
MQLERDEFNIKMGGGIPRGSLMLVEGQEGSGRSVLCQRLCYGFLSNGHSVTYISTEMTVKDFIDQMYSLDYRIADHLLARKLLYIPVYPLIGETKARYDFLARLMDSLPLYENDIIIIDSLSSLIQYSMDDSGCLLLLGFLKKIASRGKSVILTVGEEDKDVNPLRLASDIYLALKTKVSADGMQRMIQTKRFIRARNRVQDVIIFRIEPMVGLVIELTEVSG